MSGITKRVAVVDSTGLVTNAIMVGDEDRAPAGFIFVPDDAALCIPGDAWDGENFISPSGVARMPYVFCPLGPADNPEPETL